jgi:regulator of replication initiation timing
MTSNLNLKLKTAFRKPPAPPPSPIAAPASVLGATVPISLYREISADLHITRTDLDALKTQNQELTRHNQQLRLEIERVVQTALRLRQVADVSNGSGAIALEMFEEQAPSTLQASEARLMLESAAIGNLTPLTASARPLVIEQDSQLRGAAKSDAVAEVNTWWLIAVICLIVLSAFGTGFLLVRPLLPSR